MGDFRRFLSRGNVVDLAVAVIIGAAFTSIVGAIVTGLITPLVGMVVSRDFSEMTFTLNGSTFSYGLVINATINFVAVAAVVFFLIVRPMLALAARRASTTDDLNEEPAAPSEESRLLAEIRDLLRQRAP